MYKVFKGVYAIGSRQRDYLQVVECDLQDSDSYLYIGYYKLKYCERVDIYINSNSKMFSFSYGVLSKNPLTYIELFNLVNQFNSAPYGDNISRFADKELDITINLQANSMNNLLYRLSQALLFYDDYIELKVL